jgi:hypothetical protein
MQPCSQACSTPLLTPSYTFRRHKGQLRSFSSHWLTHALWYSCRQGSVIRVSPAQYSTWHTTHEEGPSSQPEVSPATSADVSPSTWVGSVAMRS